LAAAFRKSPLIRHGDSVAVVACSKAASGCFGPSNPRVVTVVRLAAETPGVGDAGRRAGPGGRARRASVAVGNNRGAIGSGFPCQCCLNRLHRGQALWFHRRCPKRARASAQPQFLRIFLIVRASDRVATWYLRSRRHCRHSVSVRAVAVERYATCWIGKPVIAVGVAWGTDLGLVDRGLCRRGRRDVFSGCAFVLAPGRSQVPPRRRRQRVGSGSPVPPFLPVEGGASGRVRRACLGERRSKAAAGCGVGRGVSPLPAGRPVGGGGDGAVAFELRPVGTGHRLRAETAGPSCSMVSSGTRLPRRSPGRP
jgi:hypothetical protein